MLLTVYLNWNSQLVRFLTWIMSGELMGKREKNCFETTDKRSRHFTIRSLYCTGKCKAMAGKTAAYAVY